MPFPVAALAIGSLALGALGVVSQMKAAREAREAERENARLIEMENIEQSRRMEAENEAAESAARARAAASGIRVGESTTGDYLSAMEEENTRQEAWLRQSGRSQAGIARQRGSAAYSQGMAGAIQSAGSTFAQGYNWFR